MNFLLMNKFNVAYIKLLTRIEGPFDRCCIWFQGCNLKCKGCGNPSLQPLVPKHVLTEEQLLNIIHEAKEKYAHVSPETLEKYGAVSEQVAGEIHPVERHIITIDEIHH